MDPRSINFASRRNLGFFLTKGRESDSNRDEHEFFGAVSRKATDLLREQRIRPANVVSELEKLDSVSSYLAIFVAQEAGKMGYADLQTPTASKAYASLIVAAALSRYANLMDKRKEDTREEDEAPRRIKKREPKKQST